MKVPKIANAIENIDEDLIIATTTYLPKKEKSPVWLKLGAMAACLCIVSATVIFLIPKKEPTQPSVEPTLPITEATKPITEATEPQNKAIITYGNIKASDVLKSDLMKPCTEEELFTREGLTAFRGTVLNLENFTADFGFGYKIYGCIATVQIEKVYKGDLVPGDTIRLRLTNPVPDPSEYKSDTSNPNIKIGAEVIATPTLFFNENHQFEENGVVLNWLDLSDCVVGYHDLFYSHYYKSLGVHFGISYPDPNFGYTSLGKPLSINHIEKYITEMLEKYGNENKDTENQETESNE